MSACFFLCIKFSHKCFWCGLRVLHKLCRQTFYLCFFLWQISLDCSFVHLSSLTCLGSIFSFITSTFFMQKAVTTKYFHCCSNSPYHQCWFRKPLQLPLNVRIKITTSLCNMWTYYFFDIFFIPLYIYICKYYIERMQLPVWDFA